MKYQYLFFQGKTIDLEYGEIEDRWFVLASPEYWPPFGYRKVWRFLSAVLTLPWYVAGDRFGWRCIGSCYFETDVKGICLRHARENLGRKNFFDPYPILMEEDLERSQKELEAAEN